jgi:hypothetical protein
VSTGASKMIEEAKRAAVDSLYSEKGHFAAATNLRRVHYWLGIPSAALAAAAASSFFKGMQTAIPALLALTAAVLTTINTFINSSEKASQHHQAGVAYGTLRRKLRYFVQVESVGTSDETILSQKLLELINALGKLQAESPPIPIAAHKKAKEMIQQGTADYTAKELESAVGTSEENSGKAAKIS